VNKGGFDEATATRRALLLGLAAAAAAPLLGCSRPDVPDLVTAEGVSREKSDAVPDTATIDGLNTFGHKLFQAAAKPGANFVVSPLSMAVAFSMLRVGARGATASELDAVFGFPETGRDAAFNAITRRLATVDVPPNPDRKARKEGTPSKPPVVSIGNALFPQKGFAVGQEFLRTLAAQYGTGVRPVDFEQQAEALKEINAWAGHQTAGRITKVFDHLDPETVLVLANTVYFKGDWSFPFDGPAPAPFTKADGQTITVETMTRNAMTGFAESGGTIAVELEYAAGPYAMWLMLPPKGAQPEDALTPEVLGRLRTGFAKTQVDVSVPKWDFASAIDLKPVLEGLGLRKIFSSTAADLSGIGNNLFVAQALHKANITVDEWGTEAAAVTALGIDATSAKAPAPVKFMADRPFAFALVGGEDRVPLFIGRVSDPGA
jgi:serpin B